MKFINLLTAQDALLELGRQPLDVSDAVALARLMRKIAQEGAIFNEQQQIIAESDGSEEEQQEARKQLLNTEMSIDGVPVKLHSVKNISAADVAALEGFVEFEGGEENG